MELIAEYIKKITRYDPYLDLPVLSHIIEIIDLESKEVILRDFIKEYNCETPITSNYSALSYSSYSYGLLTPKIQITLLNPVNNISNLLSTKDIIVKIIKNQVFDKEVFTIEGDIKYISENRKITIQIKRVRSFR